MKERLHKHKLECCSPNLKDTQKLASAASVLKLNKDLIITPIISPNKLNGADVRKSVQTDPLRLKNISNYKKDKCQNANVNDNIAQTSHLPLKMTDTIEVLPFKSKSYRDCLKNEIFEWLQDIPMYENCNSKTVKENMLNEILYEIITLSNDAININYNTLKNKIEGCLINLPLLIPGAEHDRNVFKTGLTESLLAKIKKVNAKFQHIPREQINITQSSTDSIENKITEWLTEICPDNDFENNSKESIVSLLLNYLRPILEEPMKTKNYKIVMKAYIIGILDNLSIRLQDKVNKSIYLNRFAEDLANRLLSVEYSRRRKPSGQYNFQINRKELYESAELVKNSSFREKYNLKDRLNTCLQNLNIGNNNIASDVTNLLIENIDYIRSGYENDNDITQLIYDICGRSDYVSFSTADFISKNIKDVFKETIIPRTIENPQLSGIISVYSTKKSGPVTSTPKKLKANKVVPKFSPEEIVYTQKVADLVRSWLKTLPNNEILLEDGKLRETAINDLAGVLVDTMKCIKIFAHDENTLEKHLEMVTYTWLVKFNMYQDSESLKLAVHDLNAKVKDLKELYLIKPYLESTNEIKTKKNVGETNSIEVLQVRDEIDLLEDQISMWLHEQPSAIYVDDDVSARNKIIHEMAEKVQVKLKNHKPDKEIETTVTKFLNKVIKANSEYDVSQLSESLCKRLEKLTEEQRLVQKEQKYKRMDEILKNKCCNADKMEQEVENPDKTLRDFVLKFIQHHYDTDDYIARGAFQDLLKTEILKLDGATRKHVYDNYAKSEPKDLLSLQNLELDLAYINIISDWLKTLPLEDKFNTVENLEKTKFILDLAEQIRVVENEKRINPCFGYEEHLVGYIETSIKLLPLKPDQSKNIPLIIKHLYNAIQNTANKLQIGNINNNKINLTSNLGEFIEEYINNRCKDISYDNTKLETWIARIMREVRKIVREDPHVITKSQVYHRLDSVPVPTEESVQIFELKFLYIIEICEWLRNFPLLPISNEVEELARIDLINELTDKLVKRKTRKNNESDNLKADNETVEYITEWISKLTLDNNKEIIIPILIQQLLNRIENLHKNKENSVNKRGEPAKQNFGKKDTTKKDLKKKNMVTKNKTDSKSEKNISKINPGQMVADAVENLCHRIPIVTNEQEMQSMKDNFAKQLFKKVAEINMNPNIFNDDELYQIMLKDEIDTLFDVIPNNDKFAEIEYKLKTDFITSILDARKLILHKSAGNDYFHKLVSILDVSIPNPIDKKQYYDPGFEMYKNKLVNLFILSNFDHGNEDIKLKYEKKIGEEVDKYFAHAANKNAIPLSKDQINNELFSALFKVPLPNEESVTNEVEEVKTRCEVDVWYNSLPLDENIDLNELLELDKLLDAMTKKVLELEKAQVSEDKIYKEIIKWTKKLPFLPGYTCSLNFHAKKLLNKLKETKEDRKCIIKEVKLKGKALITEISGKKGIKKSSQINKDVEPTSKGIRGISPSISLEKPKPCCGVLTVSNRNLADLIVEVVENWFGKLPIQANAEDLQIIKNDAVMKMIVKLNQLNADPNVFYDDVTYYATINEELENVFSNLPLSCGFHIDKDKNKHDFLRAVQFIKSLIEDEKLRLEYKKDLVETVAKVLDVSKDVKENKNVLLNDLKNELVEKFIQYHYNREDEEGRQFFKKQFHNIILRVINEVLDKSEDIDPLILRNKLICELEKIPIPSPTALKHEIEEIRMKEEVLSFLEEYPIPKGKDSEKVKVILSKKLFDIERTGHTCDNDRKMKEEIIKTMTKLGVEINAEKINAFVEKLKESEPYRKASPPQNNNMNEYPMPYQNNVLPIHTNPINRGNNKSSPFDLVQAAISSGTYNQNCLQSQHSLFQPLLYGGNVITDRRRFISLPPPFDMNYAPGDLDISIPLTDYVDKHEEQFRLRQFVNNYQPINKDIPDIESYSNFAGGTQINSSVNPSQFNREHLITKSFRNPNVQMNSEVPQKPHLNYQNVKLNGQDFNKAVIVPSAMLGKDTPEQSQGLRSNQTRLQNCGTTSRQYTDGMENISRKTCGQPCSIRISPDQIVFGNHQHSTNEINNQINASIHLPLHNANELESLVGNQALLHQYTGPKQEEIVNENIAKSLPRLIPGLIKVNNLEQDVENKISCIGGTYVVPGFDTKTQGTKPASTLLDIPIINHESLVLNRNTPYQMQMANANVGELPVPAIDLQGKCIKVQLPPQKTRLTENDKETVDDNRQRKIRKGDKFCMCGRKRRTAYRKRNYNYKDLDICFPRMPRCYYY